ncbi:ATP-dependent Lhr-like helicase [Nocardioides luteus]|uniref:DEAD/DEAH box helicase n=1 Tax=Nocardioides luteus TaxID=1844 RepID=A0ABQ5ST78_9ACTN|nr:crosslink repair DNA glycosylase YcaQ family protein [Nocardioides luteus]MDR7311131.1 ATP-dependent Lhr-like helicase [Nocardioides luteus]GGR62489.1 DEAD/DEAH box helicase [Nocardioides luteus]GLJ66677.1 DEAD/DEAH box helicase [Nocardioides luteus]
MSDPSPALAQFSDPTRTWFGAAFATPTAAQAGAWEAIGAGRNALVVAPTGSGKTLSAFLWSIDKLLTEPVPEKKKRCRVLYISPLKALGVDVERNLRSPLVGIRQTAERLGVDAPEVRVGVRSGDTSAADRRKLSTAPPDILITTPESLFLMLTSQARETLRNVETVIVDEVHAVAATKRGSHLALTLERLDALLEKPAQRIGLSATVRPLEEVARYLGGSQPVEIVAPPAEKRWDLSVVVPVEDMTAPSPYNDDEDDDEDPQRASSIWPHVEEHVADLVTSHRSTIVFANSRRLAERLTARLNEIAADRVFQTPPGGPPSGPPAEVMAQSGQSQGAPDVIAKAHHGSVSKEQRALIEDDLKSGRLPAVVATSSLELGIDMGAVDLVVQIESPPSVASALQRVGRAGHQVGEVSRGVLFPKHRGDLAQTAVSVQRMQQGLIESMSLPANPLDVLAQQIVAATALDTWDVDELFTLVRRTASYATLPRSAYDATLDLLAGRYPSEEFAELRPRIVWDRVAGTVTGRPGAQRLAVTSGGTIPDRGLFGVFIAGEGAGRRVGELDEEMVYESRVGDVFALGATSWRIEDITHDKVLVTPAPGVPGRLPFWKGDSLGRPAELGEAVGAYTRELASMPAKKAEAKAQQDGLDAYAAANLVTYLTEQAEATNILPSDSNIVVERFRDELGDWRLVVHSPYGRPVHAPWALAINARIRERYGVDGQAIDSDDGIVIRLPDTDAEAPTGEIIVFEPDEIEGMVTTEVGGSALFASRFRECAARALLLPRRDPGRRSPLWQQRQRSAALLEVASQYPSFPIILEAVRECLRDVYDLPSLVGLLKRIESREISIVDVSTQSPSPYAQSLLFGYVAQFLYEGDSPLAERRAAALTLDQGLLAELLGRAELRELLDPEVLTEVESELQRLAPGRKARGAEGITDLIRTIGPLSLSEIAARTTPADPSKIDAETSEIDAEASVSDASGTKTDASASKIDLSASESDVSGVLEGLATARRVVEVRVAGESRWAVVEDVARLRDGLGVAVPPGVPSAFTEPVEDPVGDLVSRYARSHGPFTAPDVAARLGLGEAVVRHALGRLAARGRVLDGEFRPGGSGLEWCDADVLRMLRRRSLARLRKEVEPVEPAALGRFLPAWQKASTSSTGTRKGALRGVDGVLSVVDQLAGCPVPASALESLILPARVIDYEPAFLDELTAGGEVLWSGHGTLPGTDGWVSLHPIDTADLTLPPPAEMPPGPLAERLLEALEPGGAWFFHQLARTVASASEKTPSDADLSAALWELVWSGRVSNDTLLPLRALTRSGTPSHRSKRPPPRARSGHYTGGGRMPARSGLPETAGRWTILPEPDPDPTKRAHAAAERLLDRHGVVTRGAVQSERTPGGFAAVYKVLSAFEESGRARRGYFVEGLGAAQFGTAGSVDRLRTFSRVDPTDEPIALALAATDPANPYGAALPWPVSTPSTPDASGHRPGRKAGAIVVLVDGELAMYVERGGRTLLTWSDDPNLLEPAAEALAAAVRRGALGRLTVEKADGAPLLGSGDTPLRQALQYAGFIATPRGLRLTTSQSR